MGERLWMEEGLVFMFDSKFIVDMDEDWAHVLSFLEHPLSPDPGTPREDEMK